MELTKELLIENVFKKYKDPELDIDVWTLGLIYEVKVDGRHVKIVLTFTSPLCPFGPQMVDDLKKLILDQQAETIDIEITFTPPWKPSDELREMLGV
ncbi:MAG: iron-sulfur cluster assembly protein [Nanoarchaeota archaeon]